AAVLLILVFLFILRKFNAEKVYVTAFSRPNIDASKRNVPQLVRIASNGLPPYRIFRIKEIEEGCRFFQIMTEDYGIEPLPQHYTYRRS
ncbi:hypothetical protein RYX36_004917, partial [Vicia faba]